MAVEDNRIKVKLNGRHFAYIDKGLLREFSSQTRIARISVFIKREIKTQFNFSIRDENDFEIFKKILSKNHYLSCGEWLRERMRIKIQEINLD